MDFAGVSIPPVTARAASTMVMPSLSFLNSVEGWHGRPEKERRWRSIWSEQTGHSPLWDWARRASMDVPGAPVDGVRTQ